MSLDDSRFIHIGGIAVGRSGTIKTVLGSCVAVVLWDGEIGIAGMNHFILPEAPQGETADSRYGVVAVPMLLDELLRAGARRAFLHAHVIGGAQVARALEGPFDVGVRNVECARRHLIEMGIKQVEEDVGGTRGRFVTVDLELSKVTVRYLGEGP